LNLDDNFKMINEPSIKSIKFESEKCKTAHNQQFM